LKGVHARLSITVDDFSEFAELLEDMNIEDADIEVIRGIVGGVKLDIVTVTSDNK
jgi:hypothetical protein